MKMEPVPFREAIDWASERGVVLPNVYYGELQGLARAASFSIAGITSHDQLQFVRDSLTAATANGETYAQWKEKVASGEYKLELPEHRLENIFRTNIQNHYNRGRCEQHKRNFDTRPWLLYDSVNDSRTRPAHLAMDGFIARYDNPIWKKWNPPCGYQCRCRVIALSDRQADKYIQADLKRRTEKPELAQEREKALNRGPDKGWDYSICEEPTEGLKRAVDNKLGKGTTLTEAKKLLDRIKTATENPNPIAPVITNIEKEEFTQWVKVVTPKEYKATHETKRIGTLPLWVLEYPKVITLNPESPDIYVSDYQIRHAVREFKDKEDHSLPMAVIEQLPYFLERAVWFFDERHNNLLAVFYYRDGDKLGKAAIEINFQRNPKADPKTSLKTAGIISIKDIISGKLQEILPW